MPRHLSATAELKFAGVVFNKVGGPAHGAWLREALEAAVEQGRLKQAVAVLGCTPKVCVVSCVPCRAVLCCAVLCTPTS
jgi:cobyrinic acid a,c-diamide synthase